MPGAFLPYPWVRAVEVEHVEGQGMLLSSFTTREVEVGSHLLLDNQVSRMLNPCECILPSARASVLRPTSHCHGYKAAETGLHDMAEWMQGELLGR